MQSFGVASAQSQLEGGLTSPPLLSILRGAVKIGRPGYRVTKQFDQGTQQRSLLFQASMPTYDESHNLCLRMVSASALACRSIPGFLTFCLHCGSPLTLALMPRHPSGGVPRDRGGHPAQVPLHVGI